MARIDAVTGAQQYGMYSEEGDAEVAKVVAIALGEALKLGWSDERAFNFAVGYLQGLADRDGTREAMDTAVRDEVWAALQDELPGERIYG